MRNVADWDAEVSWLISDTRRKSVISIATRLAFACFSLPGLDGEKQQSFPVEIHSPASHAAVHFVSAEAKDQIIAHLRS